MKYVIIYINDRMVQRHRVYCLVSRVNILLQWKVQRITHTSLMQVSTVVLYLHMRNLGVNFIHMENCLNFSFSFK